MFRLLIALGVAAILLPAETISKTDVMTTQKVSAYEAYNAAHSLFMDVSTFCERNEETCTTGQALASSAINTVQRKLNGFASSQQDETPSKRLDIIETGAVQK